MKIQTLALAAIVALTPLISNADWVLVDDFQDGDLGDWTLHAGNPEHVSLKILMAPAWASPEDPITGGLFIDQENYSGATFSDVIAGKTLPISIQPDGTATLYWRVWMSGATNANWYVMLSDLAAPGAFADHVTVVRWATPSTTPPGVLQAWDGEDYKNLEVDGAPFLPQTERWHDFWLVMNPDQPPAESAWSLYWQGPSDSSPQGPLVLVDESGASKFAFRRQPESAIQTISIGTVHGAPSATSNIDFWIIDDIYISEGINLTRAEYWPPQFCDDYVDTGSFLGWIYLQCDSWAYHEELGWFYLPEENLTAHGGWVHIPR